MKIVDLIRSKEKDAMAVESAISILLDRIGLSGTSFGWDDYDSSIELCECENDLRLTPEQQEAFFNEGFSIIFLNHKDNWETHYSTSIGRAPWRVSYPDKRGEKGGPIFLEVLPPGDWPREWLETGYIKVIAP